MYFDRHIKLIELSWKVALKDKLLCLKLLLAPLLFSLYAVITQKIGGYIEGRRGVKLPDQILTLFPNIDFSVPVFSLLYSSMLLFLFTHLSKPRVLILALEMHLLVAIARQICILAFALEPPSGMIILTDFFLENTFYPTDTPLTKDLFFSGHVATIWIYVLCSQIEYLKMYLFFATLAMTFMVLCMRIHYTYDVYGAIVITSSIYFLQLAIRRYKAVTKSYTSVPISNTNASK